MPKILAYSGDVMNIQGKNIVLDLNGLVLAEAGVPILSNHEPDIQNIVGQMEKFEITDEGLLIEAKFLDTPAANQIKALSKDGYKWQASVAGDIIEEEEIKEDEYKEVNGKQIKGPAIIARKWLLREVSIVVLGADDAARLIEANKKFTPFKSSLVDSKYEKFNFIISKVTGVNNMSENYNNILAAAVVKSLSLPTKGYTDRELEESDKYKNMGLGSLIFECARLNGYTGTYKGDLRVQLEYAMGFKAAYSTVNLQSIIKDVAERAINRAFVGVDQAWRDVARIRSVTSFRKHDFYRATGSTVYEPVGPGGELPLASFEDTVYTGQIETQGKYMVIDRKHIINDDLGVIDDLTSLFARGAALRLNNMFWSEFLNNSTFFTSARGNFLTGASTALSIDALSQAEAAFMLLKDESGEFTGLMPSKLLVPVSLSALATQLVSSTTLFDTDNKAVNNPHAGKFKPIPSRYLEDSRLTGYSNKAWYLLASPEVASVIDVLALDGRVEPTIETVELTTDRLGLAMRGYFDVGVVKADWQAGVKMAGQ